MVNPKNILNFTLNCTEYTIVEVDTIGDSTDTVGLTDYQFKKVYIRRLDYKFMIRTLKHELTHVWLYEYGHNQSEKEFNNEDVCEIVACSNGFINEIVKRYIEKRKEVNYGQDN